MSIRYKGNYLYIHEGYKTNIIDKQHISSILIDRRRYIITLEVAGKTMEFNFKNHYNRTDVSHYFTFLGTLKQALHLDPHLMTDSREVEDIPTNEVSSD